MQKKIYRTMTALVTTTVLALLMIVGSIGYSAYQKSAKNDLKAVASIMVKENKSPEEISQLLLGVLDFKVRVTFIAEDGTVEFDSDYGIENMENHSDREEFKKALENGSAEASRMSETIGESTYYYAVKYQGGVLRFSTDRNNLAGVLVTVVPVILTLCGSIIIITTIISVKLSESLIRPINSLVKQLDLRKENIGEMETPYEELKPIIRNADVLMKRIHRNVAKIKREKEKISLITANMVEGMVLIDENMKVLSVNKSALKILGGKYDPEYKPAFNRLTQNETLLRYVDDARENGYANGVVTIRGRHYRAFVNRADSENSFNLGIIILLMDVTEIIQTEEIRKDFSANVSHELKTPLTTIKGFGELLEQGIFTEPEDIKKYGGMIYRESVRLLSLINDIIRLSEIEESEHNLQDSVNLLKTANDVEEILQNKAYNHKVEIKVEGEPLIIKGHQGYITELFLNLMDNAVKYNNEGGNVWVKISKSKDTAKILFKDNGIGISEEDCGRIFERFYRVDKSRSKQTGGTGLGLSIVKHIVSYHNGEISINSKLGEGTEITVNLPIANE
ncbi:MAG: ATP-binding protein [Hominimerdicola sp.]